MTVHTLAAEPPRSDQPGVVAPRPRVAFVVQRCGLRVIGGAESLCLQVAERLSRYWDVHIVTTCALDYMEWTNHYPPGVEQLGPVKILRFPVDYPRDVSHFDELSAQLRRNGSDASAAEQEQWMRAQGPVSTELLAYLREHRETYDTFFFFGYLYATTYFGLSLVRSKGYLVPLAHDEWTIHLPIWDDFFTQPAGFVFQTTEEQQFLRDRFPHAELDGPIAGVGVEPPSSLRVDQFRKRYDLCDPFLLYVGRVDASKGCSEMFDFFLRGRQAGTLSYKLVLVGREVLPIPFDDDIVFLGQVAEEEKWDALAAAHVLLMPSRHESLSIAALEAWSVGCPVIATAKSKVLVGHCRRSNAGLWYDDEEEWLSAIGISSQLHVREELGANGKSYVESHYTWAVVEKRYLAAARGAK